MTNTTQTASVHTSDRLSSGGQTSARCSARRSLRRRSLRPSGVILLLIAITAVTACATAGGSREEVPEPARAAGPVAGEVIAIEDAGDVQLLTVRRADGSEVYVEVPDRLARTLRIQVGDRIRSEEHTAARPGERLRVQRLTIDRG